MTHRLVLKPLAGIAIVFFSTLCLNAQSKAEDSDVALALAATQGDHSSSGGGSLLQMAAPAAAFPSFVTTAPAFLAEFVSAGVPGPGVPCFNCVTGNTTGNVGLGFPLSFLTQGTSIQYTLFAQNNTLNASCTFAYAVVQAKKVIQKGNLKPTTCMPGLIYYANFPVTVPTKPGAATLVGILISGTTKSAATSSIYIQ